MALDFTVVFSVRQRFGDTQRDDFGLEMDAPFVGMRKDFTFSCPGVDSSQSALILYQSQGVNERQSMEINNTQVFGGIPSSVEATAVGGSVNSTTQTVDLTQILIARWNGNVMLIQNGVLRERDNVLRIESDGDNFIIDNVVVLYKTRAGVISPTVDPIKV